MQKWAEDVWILPIRVFWHVPCEALLCGFELEVLQKWNLPIDGGAAGI